MRLFVETEDLIGDTLMATPALRRLAQEGTEVVAVAREGGLAREVLRHNLHVAHLWTREEAEKERRPADRWVALNAAQAQRDSAARHDSMFDGFARQLGTTVADYRIDLVLTVDERRAGRALLTGVGKPYKTVVCARHSTTCLGNLQPGCPANKCFPNAVWRGLADWLLELGYVPLAVGAAAEAADPLYADWPGPRLYGHPLRAVAGLVAAARAVVSVDTGVRFLAAATGCDLACVSGAIPTWHIFSPPSRPDQKIVERLIPVPRVTTERVKEMVWPLL